MKRKLAIVTLALAANSVGAQQIINAWWLNNTVTAKYWEVVAGTPTGNLINTGSLADCQKVCYTTDSVWVEATGLAEIMGPYLNPGVPTDQDYTFRFPRNPVVQSGAKTETPVVFAVGLLVNGVAAYGNSNAKSWDPGTSTNANSGQGIWNVDAYYAEGMVLDSTYGGHPQQAGAYHSHGVPKTLYGNSVTTHSPLIGFAFDGFPIYGPYGYTTALDNTSPIKLIESGYQLRSITTRTTLPDGTVLPPPNYGPAVSATYPLGNYMEDYDWVSGAGDLDEYNGRFCVTPEYPAGIYAYFVTKTAAGIPTYPYFIGTHYYGKVVTDDLIPSNPITTPASTSCITTGIDESNTEQLFSVYPNPSSDVFNIVMSANVKEVNVQLYNMKGSMVLSERFYGTSYELNASHLDAGIYLVKISLNDGSLSCLKLQKK